MRALEPNTHAPEITLSDLRGSRFVLSEQLQRGPVVLAFFKISCPICQYTFPFLDRLYRGFQGKANVVGVSQNTRRDTELFVREYGVTFCVLLDDKDTYPASNAYGLTNVPSIFLIASDGTVEQTVVGWSRAEVETMARRLAEMLQEAPAPVFRPGEDIASYKAG